PDQQVMNEQVRVDAGGPEQQVAKPHRARYGWHRIRHAPNAVAADTPQRLERERFPVRLAPMLDVRFAESLEELRQACVRRLPRFAGSAASSAVQIAQGPGPRFVNQSAAHRAGYVWAHAPQRVRLRDEPEKLGRRTVAQWVLHHRQAQIEACAQARDLLAATRPQAPREHRLQVSQADSPLGERLAVLLLAQVRLTAEKLARVLDGF